MRRRLRGFDPFGWGVVAVFVALSVAFLGVIALAGGDSTWAEGFTMADQAQYLVWIRQFAEPDLVANRFDLAPDQAVLLHPLALSGLLHVLGVPIAFAYLAWKPVAIAVLLFGVWRYVHGTLRGIWERRAAVVLALFFVPPANFVVGSITGLGSEVPAIAGHLTFIAGEVWPPGYLWGYPMTAISLGLLALALLWCARGSRLLAAGAAFALAFAHPWQAMTFLAIVGTTGAWQVWSRELTLQEAVRALLPAALAALVPLAYYAGLTVVDESWARTAEVYRDDYDRWPIWTLLVSLAPLALPALLGYRGPASGFAERALRLWPALCVVLYLLPVGTFPFHAFNGISIPLAVLAVRGLSPYVASAASPRVAAACAVVAVALLTVPGAIERVRLSRIAVGANLEPYRLEPGEAKALDALEQDSGPGGVVATFRLGQLVPFKTGREAWLGHPSWTPDFRARDRLASELFEGDVSLSRARVLAADTGARYVMAGCGQGGGLRSKLGPLVVRERRFGCARVLELRRTVNRGADGPAHR